MEVRFESMVFLWDDKIPTMFLEFMNLLTLCQSCLLYTSDAADD